MKSSEVVSGSALTLLTRVGTFLLNFSTLVLISRALGPQNIGLYALLTLVPATLVSLGMPSVGIANVYLSGQGKHELSKIAGNSLVGAVLFSVALWGLVGLISLLPVSDVVLTSRGVNSAQLWLVVAALPFCVLSKWYGGILRGMGRIGLFNVVTLSGVLIQFSLAVTLSLLGALDLLAVLGSYVLCNLGAAIAAFVLIRRVTSIRFSPDWPLIKATLRYSAKAYLWSGATYLDGRSALMLVAILISATELGYYAVAVSLSEKLWNIAESVATVLFPFVSAPNQDRVTAHITSAVCRYVFMLSSVISLCVGILAGPLVEVVFGAEFMPAIRPLRVLLFGVAVVSIARLIAVDFAGRGDPEVGALSASISAIVSIVLVLLFAPGYGIVGAALATIVGYLAAAVVMVTLFSRKHHIPGWHLAVPMRADWHNAKRMASALAASASNSRPDRKIESKE